MRFRWRGLERIICQARNHQAVATAVRGAKADHTINQKEAFSADDEAKALINEAMTDIESASPKIGQKKMHLISDGAELKEIWQRTITSFARNFGQESLEPISLCEAFMEQSGSMELAPQPSPMKKCRLAQQASLAGWHFHKVAFANPHGSLRSHMPFGSRLVSPEPAIGLEWRSPHSPSHPACLNRYRLITRISPSWSITG